MMHGERQPVHLRHGRRRRAALPDVPGLRLVDGHRGVYAGEGVTFDVLIASAERVTLRAPIVQPPSEEVAFAAAEGLAGNLRFARGRAGLALVADAQLDSGDFLRASLDAFARALRRVRDGSDGRGDDPHDPCAPELDAARVDAAVDGLAALDDVNWPADALVRPSDAHAAWELRPRFQLPGTSGGATPLPVRLTRERGGLRVHRTLLRARPLDASPCGRALAVLALRLNDRLRFARLAPRGNALCVEAHLAPELVTSRALGETARAVAAGSAGCQPTVTLLSSESSVAEVVLAALVTRPVNP